MRGCGLLLLTALFSHSPSAAQEGGLLKMLDGKPGIATLSRETYEGKGLYGYIDGGAELYHEYGFVRLEVRTIRADRETLTVEAYEMSDPFAAAGILSVSRGGCSPDTSLGPLAFSSRFQSQAASGRAFIRVVSEKGSESGRLRMRQVAGMIREGIPSPPPGRHAEIRPAADLFGLIGRGLLAEGNYPPILARGPLGLQNGLDGWTELFDGCGRYDLVTVSADTMGGEITMGSVTFALREDRERVLRRWPLAESPVRRYHSVKQDTLLLVEIRGTGSPVDEWEKAIRDSRVFSRDQR